jgi:hypothetical protein
VNTFVSISNIFRGDLVSWVLYRFHLNPWSVSFAFQDGLVSVTSFFLFAKRNFTWGTRRGFRTPALWRGVVTLGQATAMGIHKHGRSDGPVCDTRPL